MTTQFSRQLALDIPATCRHIESMIAAGASGIVMLGSLGENLTLDSAEKIQLVRAAVKTARGRVPVISGVIETSTLAACRYAESAAKAGVAGLMVLPAMVYRADARETLTHYRSVARAADLPVICYNNPLAYHIDITPTMFADLADDKRFVAIKESSGDVRRFTDLRLFVGNRYQLFCGVDDLLLEAVALGASTGVVPLAHTAAAPRHCDQVRAVHQAGLRGARLWHRVRARATPDAHWPGARRGAAPAARCGADPAGLAESGLIRAEA
jgi:4-hydroxy-tetrahydrodipicolinate synthase